MDTIQHRGAGELVEALRPVVDVKKITRFAVGLPRLPGGDEGSQAGKVRDVAAALEQAFGLPVEFVDERFTSQQRGMKTDSDARSAIAILQIVLEKYKKGVDK